jgi:hypothetical protein
MAITELAHLCLLPPHTWDQPQVASFFQRLSTLQSAASGYPLLFFHKTSHSSPALPVPNVENDGAKLSHKDVIVLISGWENRAAHHAWVASEPNQQLLHEANGKLLEIVEFTHLDLPFNECQAQLQSARVLYCERMLTGGDKAIPGVSWTAHCKAIDEGRDGIYIFASFTEGGMIMTGLNNDKLLYSASVGRLP